MPLVELLFRAAGPADATARGPKTVCPSGLRGWTRVPLAQAAWAQIPRLSCFCWIARREICSAARMQTTPGCLEPVWPSGLRHKLQAPVSKGVGSNPSAVIHGGVALVSPCPRQGFRGPVSRSRQPRQQLDWLKAPARKGAGSNPAPVTRFALFCARRMHRAKRCQRPRQDSNLQARDPQADASSIGPRGGCSRSTLASSLLHPGLGGAAPATEAPCGWRPLGEASLRAWRCGRASGSKSAA